MYDRAKMDVARGERKVERIEYKEKHLLPLDTSDLRLSEIPTQDPFSAKISPMTSATEKHFREPPRRRSWSISERPVILHPNWNLGGIMEMTPPVTPRGTPPDFQPPPPPPPPRSENRGVIVPKGRQQKRRYSGSSHVLEQVNGTQKLVRSPRTPEGIQRNVS